MEAGLMPDGKVSEIAHASVLIAGTRLVLLKSARTVSRTVLPGNSCKAACSAAVWLTAAELVGAPSWIPACARSVALAELSTGGGEVVAAAARVAPSGSLHC